MYNSILLSFREFLETFFSSKCLLNGGHSPVAKGPKRQLQHFFSRNIGPLDLKTSGISRGTKLCETNRQIFFLSNGCHGN